MLQANSLLLILSRANRIGVLPRLLAGFAGSQAPVRVALRGRHFRGMIAPNNSFNPNPLRCFVQTCRKLLQCRLRTSVAAGRVNSGVRRLPMKAEDFLLRDLSDEELRQLPKDWIAVYLSRPRDTRKNDRDVMYLRVTLLGLLILFVIVNKLGYGIVPLLLFTLGCYEVAYYTLRREKSLNDWAAAHRKYVKRVRKLSGSGA